MTDTLLSGIYAAVATVVAALITVGVTLFIENRKLKGKNKEFERKVEQMASTGIALGYYYNFIENIYMIIKENRKISLEIYNALGDKIIETKEFNSDNIRIEVLMPRSLDTSAFTQAMDILKQHKKGDIVRIGKNRNYGVNFSVQDRNSLIIVDVPTPLFALEKYLKSLDMYSTIINPETNEVHTKSDSEEYRARQLKEMKNFESTVISFIKSNGHAVNKVHFRHLT